MANVHPPPLSTYVKAMVDGRVAGYISASLLEPLVNRCSLNRENFAEIASCSRLRFLKAVNDAGEAHRIAELDTDEQQIPSDLEIGYIPHFEGGMFPGLYLFTLGGRLIREVRQITSGMSEWIGPLEQQHLMIQVPDDSIKETKSDASHQEIHTKNILSILASLTPFSEFNQSPRNMYQCQMAKQTMGTPCLDFQFRPDNKLYRSAPHRKKCSAHLCRCV